MLLLQKEGALQERLPRLQEVGREEGVKRQRVKEERPFFEPKVVSRPHERATPEVASAVVAIQQHEGTGTPVGNKEATVPVCDEVSCLDVTVPMNDQKVSCLGVMDPADCNEIVSVQRVCAGISSVEIDKVFPHVSSVSCRSVKGNTDAEAEDDATDTVSYRDVVGVYCVATAGVDVFHEPVPVEAMVTADKGAVSCRIRDQQSTQKTVSCRNYSGRHSGRQAASGCKVKCGVG